MKATELNPDPDLSVPVLPVLCERCKAEGAAGDEAFANIPDILAFTPVPRRARADGWKPEHQRAFIAALAITGSARMAARTIGKHQFGAEQLRNARGGRSFAEAWDAALDLAREREFARIRENLGDLASDTQGALARMDPAEYDDDEDREARELAETRERIRSRLLNARRLYLAEIEPDPARRAAWELLCGPVDWDKAQRAEAQDNEPFEPNMRKPDMILPVDNGWLGEATGGEDKTAVLREELASQAPSVRTL